MASDKGSQILITTVGALCKMARGHGASGKLAKGSKATVGTYPHRQNYV
jgi:hypothetical protein